LLIEVITTRRHDGLVVITSINKLLSEEEKKKVDRDKKFKLMGSIHFSDNEEDELSLETVTSNKLKGSNKSQGSQKSIAKPKAKATSHAETT